MKGYEHYHAKTNQVESAIDSYRQAIRLNPSNIDAMHNLGCSYDVQQRFELGMQWFDRVIQIDPNMHDAYHGYALCAFKLGQPKLAIEKLDKVIDMIITKKKQQLGEDFQASPSFKDDDKDHQTAVKNHQRMLETLDVYHREDFNKIYFRYLRALCHKALLNYDESQRDYNAINRAFEISEGRNFSKQIFAMIIMPLQVNRKNQLKMIQTFENILERYESDKDRKILAPYYIRFIDQNKYNSSLQNKEVDARNKKWVDKFQTKVLKTL